MAFPYLLRIGHRSNRIAAPSFSVPHFPAPLHTMSDSALLQGVTLVNAKGETRAGEMLGAAGRVLALYFAADWCPDCRDFQPALNKFYAKTNAPKPLLDVVFVGSDRSEAAQQEHFEHKQGAWWALPYDSPLRDELKRKYGVCAGSEQVAVGVKKRVGGIPSLVVIRQDGELLDLHGVDRIESDAAGALDHWQHLSQ